MVKKEQRQYTEKKLIVMPRIPESEVSHDQGGPAETKRPEGVEQGRPSFLFVPGRTKAFLDPLYSSFHVKNVWKIGHHILRAVLV
jgi:hypothetical protein